MEGAQQLQGLGMIRLGIQDLAIKRFGLLKLPGLVVFLGRIEKLLNHRGVWHHCRHMWR